MTNIIKLMDVISKDRRREADRLRQDFYMAAQSEEQTEDDTELTPIEELSGRIISGVSYASAKAFEEMIKDVDPDIVQTIVNMMEHSDNETAARILQATFVPNRWRDSMRQIMLSGTLFLFP